MLNSANEVIICGYLRLDQPTPMDILLGDSDKNYCTVFSSSYKKCSKEREKDPTKDIPLSKNSFLISCIIAKNCVGYNNDFVKPDTLIPVTLIGTLKTNDDTNLVLIKYLKKGFSSEKNIVLLQGIIDGIHSSSDESDKNVWNISLKCPNTNNILIDFPINDNKTIYPYNSTDYLTNNNTFFLIGYINKSIRKHRENVVNGVYPFNYDENAKEYKVNSITKPCPFLFSYENSNGDEEYIYSMLDHYPADNDNIYKFKYEFYHKIIDINNISDNILDNEKNPRHELFNVNNLKKFRDLINKNNIYYRPQDIINFFTAMKNDGLTILAGLSGTGKTQLVNLFAESLGISLDSDQFLHISVKPSWKDDSALIGVLYPIGVSNNEKEGYKYIPDNPGLINTLIRANRPENRNNEYIILLDEMNLARVEYYFSQFLSELERPVKDRYIILYDKSETKRCINSDKYKYRIHVGRNVHFVGTINTDESTYKISDKVLDRSNFITLPTFSSVMNSKKFVQLFYSWELNTDKVGLTHDNLTILYDISNTINHISDQLGVSWRVVKGINEYLCNLPNFDELKKQIPKYVSNFNNANEYYQCGFDYQILQRILCKISGTPSTLLKTFKIPKDNESKSKGESENKYSGKLYKIINGNDLPLSKKYISRKFDKLSDEYYDI